MSSALLEEKEIRKFKDRLRIFFILYFFSEPYSSPDHPNLRKVFNSEVRIQKIDFLIRNPDYLALELLNLVVANKADATEVKSTIKEIFNNQEPDLRRLDMERFFFGAWEDLDDVIAFLVGIDFVRFSSKKASDLTTIQKKYFITESASLTVSSKLSSLGCLSWYAERCELIKKYFGDMSGTQLKVSQYQIKEYRETTYRDYISSVADKVKVEFKALYGEEL